MQQEHDRIFNSLPEAIALPFHSKTAIAQWLDLPLDVVKEQSIAPLFQLFNPSSRFLNSATDNHTRSRSQQD